MNKLLREHAAWRAYQDAAPVDPTWNADGFLSFLLPKKGPRRALNIRVRPALRRPLPRHEPAGARLLRRIRKRSLTVQSIAALAALSALGEGQ